MEEKKEIINPIRSIWRIDDGVTEKLNKETKEEEERRKEEKNNQN